MVKKKRREKKLPLPRLSPACGLNQHGPCAGTVRVRDRSFVCECMCHVGDENPRLPDPGGQRGDSY